MQQHIKIAIVLLVFLFLGIQSASAQVHSHPLYEVETPEWYSFSSSWVYQAPNGEMLLGLSGETRVFDGGKWTIINDLAGLNVLSIGTHENELWIGLDNDFGILKPNSRDSWEFQSMTHLLPEGTGVQNQIIGVHSLGDILLLTTFRDIYIWDGSELKAYTGKQILDEVMEAEGKKNPYNNPLVNFTNVVQGELVQQIVPYGYVTYRDGAFRRETKYANHDWEMLFGFEEFGDSGLVAATLGGIFKRKGDSWEEVDIPMSEEDESDVFWGIEKISNSLLVLFSEEEAYLVDQNFNVLFNTSQVGGSNNAWIPYHVTKTGTIWMLREKSIVRIYPQLPAQKISLRKYTYSENGEAFAWHDSDLIVSDAFGSAKYSVQIGMDQLGLTKTNIFKEGNGSIIGVYQNEDVTLLPHQNEFLEYENDTLLTEIELEYNVQSFFMLAHSDDHFLTGVRGGLGVLRREAGSWEQQIIMEDPEYANLANVIPVEGSGNMYRGATEQGTIFEVAFDEATPSVRQVYNLKEELDIQQIQDICYLGDDFTVLTNRGVYQQNAGSKEWESFTKFQNEMDGYYMQNCTAENGDTYLYGENNSDTGIWKYEDGKVRRIPVQSGRLSAKLSISPSGELWLPEFADTKIVDVEEAFGWYHSTKTKLMSWVEYDSILVSSDINTLELPHDYLSFTIHGGFNNHFFQSENQFRLLINGSLSSGWQNNSTYSFANLPSGEYAIQIEGRNGLGQIHRTKVFDLEILPPWYLSTLALNMYVLGGLLFIGFVVHGYGQYRARQQEALDKIKLDEREKVRKKLAADFHDELGNRITRIGLHIKILQQGKGDKMEGILSKMESNTNSLYAETRDFIWQMDPRKDSLYDTYGWLKTFGDEFFEHSRIDFIAKPIQPEVRQVTLDMEARTNIVRIFKEAMNNAQKYSGASICTLSLSRNGANATIELKDNGKGMDLDAALTKGNGLNNMTDRAKESGGVLSISSKPGEGTNIRYSFIWNTEKMRST